MGLRLTGDKRHATNDGRLSYEAPSARIGKRANGSAGLASSSDHHVARPIVKVEAMNDVIDQSNVVAYIESRRKKPAARTLWPAAGMEKKLS